MTEDYVPERATNTERKRIQMANFIACSETYKHGDSNKLGYNHWRTYYVIKYK
jgi:hypothetical protein